MTGVLYNSAHIYLPTHLFQMDVQKWMLQFEKYVHFYLVYLTQQVVQLEMGKEFLGFCGCDQNGVVKANTCLLYKQTNKQTGCNAWTPNYYNI